MEHLAGPHRALRFLARSLGVPGPSLMSLGWWANILVGNGDAVRSRLVQYLPEHMQLDASPTVPLDCLQMDAFERGNTLDFELLFLFHTHVSGKGNKGTSAILTFISPYLIQPTARSSSRSISIRAITVQLDSDGRERINVPVGRYGY